MKMLFQIILVSSLTWLVGGALTDYNAPFQTSVTVPVGTVLPRSMRDADALLKLAIKRNNAFSAPLSSEWGGLVEPSLRFQVFLQNAPTNDSFLLAQEFCNHVTHRAHSIIGTLDSTTVSTMASYSKAFQIPWLSPSHTTPDIKSDYLISLHPRLEKFFLCLIRTIRFTKITYIYDGQEVHLPVKALLSFASKHKMEVRVLDVGGNPNVLPVLKDIACRADYQLIYDVTKERSLQIMRQIYAIGMMSYEYLHVFTSVGLIEEDISQFASGSAKLYFISIVDWERPNVESARREMKANLRGQKVEITDEGLLVYDAFTAMAVGMKSIARKSAVFNVDQMGIDTVNCHQIPIVPLPTGLVISQAIKSVSFTGLTGNVEFDSTGERVNYEVSLYSGERSGVARIGTWTDRVGEFGQLVINGTIPRVNVLEIIRNQTLIVTTILEEPYVTLKSNWREMQGNERFEGYCVDLLKEITTLAPFQYQIKPVEDGQYGSRNDRDGTWNGMIGEVKYQKAHLAVAPLTITSAREAVVDFTKPFMSLGISIMIKKPQKQTPNIFSFLEPLSNEIWICIAFAYTGVSVVLYLVSRLSPYEWHKGALTSNITQEEEADSVTDFGIMNSFWFSLGAFVQQGCDISPKSFSGRIVGGVWWFFTLIIISSYTANLAAFLTVDRMVSPISGAEDLAKQNIIKYGTLRSGSTSNFFKQSPLPTYEKMWGFMNSQDPTVFVSSSKAGIERVRKSNGKYAFLMESTLNDYIEQREPCDTMKVGPNIDAKGYGIALAKGSPLYDTVNLAILTLREQGKLQKMKNRWWYDKSECGAHGSAPPAKTPALMLSNVAGVFYILIVGMILAVLFSIVEYCYVAITARIAKKAGADAKRRDSQRLSGTLSGRQATDLPR